MQSRLGWGLETGKYILPAAMSASVSLLRQLENAYLPAKWKTTWIDKYFFFSSSLACPFLLFSVLKRFPSSLHLLFSNCCLVLFTLLCLDSALCLLYLLPNNFCAQKHQVQFCSPCHQTKPLSCPLLPAVISVSHLLNPQASFIPRQISLLVLSWNVFYGFWECFCLFIFHDGFDFGWCYFLCWYTVQSKTISMLWLLCLLVLWRFLQLIIDVRKKFTMSQSSIKHY